MEGKIFVTEDGSHSVLLRGTNLAYHSIHGAIQESKHIFINAGLRPKLEEKHSPLRIFEMGFGTGLNALLTLAESESHSIDIFYHGIDLYFIPQSISDKLNFCQKDDLLKWQPAFQIMHASEPGKLVRLSPNFNFLRSMNDILQFDTREKFNLVYYDAFAPDDQPELWSKGIFEKIYDWLLPGALLLTYSAKGEVRRALEKGGFKVKKMPGPPGKREFIVANK